MMKVLIRRRRKNETRERLSIRKRRKGDRERIPASFVSFSQSEDFQLKGIEVRLGHVMSNR